MPMVFQQSKAPYQTTGKLHETNLLATLAVSHQDERIRESENTQNAGNAAR